MVRSADFTTNWRPDLDQHYNHDIGSYLPCFTRSSSVSAPLFRRVSPPVSLLFKLWLAVWITRSVNLWPSLAAGLLDVLSRKYKTWLIISEGLWSFQSSIEGPKIHSFVVSRRQSLPIEIPTWKITLDCESLSRGLNRAKNRVVWAQPRIFTSLFHYCRTTTEK